MKMKNCSIVFSDIDGTLLDSSHRLRPLTRQAILYLAKSKIPFVPVSARSPSGIFPILNEIGLRCPLIAYSGALVLDENKSILFHRGMEKAVAEEIVRYLDGAGYDLSWCLYSFDRWIVKDRADPRIAEEERIVKTTAIAGTMDDIPEGTVHKILLICSLSNSNQIEAELKKRFPRLTVVKSSSCQIEITAQGVGKAEAVERFCALRKIDLFKALAFGDNYNDEAMLKIVGKGVLMGNAPEELKRIFAEQASDNDHDGIYRKLIELELI